MCSQLSAETLHVQTHKAPTTHDKEPNTREYLSDCRAFERPLQRHSKAGEAIMLLCQLLRENFQCYMEAVNTT